MRINRVINFITLLIHILKSLIAQWLEHLPYVQAVSGSIPDERIFYKYVMYLLIKNHIILFISAKYSSTSIFIRQ